MATYHDTALRNGARICFSQASVLTFETSVFNYWLKQACAQGGGGGGGLYLLCVIGLAFLFNRNLGLLFLIQWDLGISLICCDVGLAYFIQWDLG
jgi:hypothetical protein